MTLPKKNSRSIEVDATRFRYVISRLRTCDAGQFSLNVTVQIENGRGRILAVRGILTRERWLDFPKLESSDQYPVIKPGHIALIVRHARACGWDPGQEGIPFHLTITSEEFQI
jgi:hypothetical protein